MRHHINGYGKPLPNLISTERSCKIQYEDWPHCSAFDGENVKTVGHVATGGAILAIVGDVSK